MPWALMLRSFNPKYMLFWRVRNIAFWCLPELYYSAGYLFRSWLCRLVRVPGHCGIHGNEDANALARAKSSSAFVVPEPCLLLAPSSVKRRVLKK
jgi:hypothetical protein